jgi:hypothetical protein
VNGSPIAPKSSERYNKNDRLFCEWKKENAVNEGNVEAMLECLFDLVSLVFLILWWNINQSRYSLRKCLVPRSGLNSQWLIKPMLVVHENVDIYFKMLTLHLVGTQIALLIYL